MAQLDKISRLEMDEATESLLSYRRNTTTEMNRVLILETLGHTF